MHVFWNLEANLSSSNKIDLRETQQQTEPRSTSKNVEKDLSMTMKLHSLTKLTIPESGLTRILLMRMKLVIIGHFCTSILGYQRSLKTNSIATLIPHHPQRRSRP